MSENRECFKELDKKLCTAADKLRSNLDATVYDNAGQFAESAKLQKAIRNNMKALGLKLLGGVQK